MRTFPILVLAAFSASCGAANNLPGSKNEEPLTQEQGAQQYADGLCAVLSRCFGEGIFEALFGGDGSCAPRAKASALALFSQPGASATGDQLAACGRAYGNLSCADALQGPEPSECRLPGTLAAGTSCASEVQCSTLYCKFGTAGGCGTCATRAAAGGSCASTSECPDGSVCKGGVCASVRVVAVGGACNDSDVAQKCVLGSYCKGPGGAASGTCTAYAAAGDNCADTECDVFKGLLCNSADVCVSYSASAAGGSCGGESNNVCADSGTCMGATTTVSGTCGASIPVGGTCSSTAGPSCQYPADCNTNGVCSYVPSCQ